MGIEGPRRLCNWLLSSQNLQGPLSGAESVWNVGYMAFDGEETKGLEHDAGYNHETYAMNISVPSSLSTSFLFSQSHGGIKTSHQRMWFNRSIVVDPNTKITFEELFPGVVGGWHRLAIRHAALTNKLNDSSFCRTTISVVREEEPGDKTLKQPTVLCTLVPMIIEQVRLDYTLALDRKAGYILVEGPNPVNISMEAAPSVNERVNGTGPNNAKTHPLTPLSTSLSLEKANFPGVDKSQCFYASTQIRDPRLSQRSNSGGSGSLVDTSNRPESSEKTSSSGPNHAKIQLLCSAPTSSSTLNRSSTMNLTREPRFYQRPNFSAVGDQETIGHRPSSVVLQAPSYKQSYLKDKPRYRRYRNYNANDHYFSSDHPPMKRREKYRFPNSMLRN
ncbi:hypothetical protein C8R41DRAFT_866945 [Lentinula lateritia]|uniref:Nucleoplasmin-like domain-containing protein n=1 Tax=Lentinula lateritia TaxID=40482 RepID=A0ABQ8VG95_9AGAR|nr:hypothetical protein C8R41DRAFT_866945 [Lentinula lateritia]